MAHPYKSKAQATSAAKAKNMGGALLEAAIGGAGAYGASNALNRIGKKESKARLPTLEEGKLRDAFKGSPESLRRRMRLDEHKAGIISDVVPRREEKRGGRLPTAGMEGGLGRLQLSKIQKAKRT